MSIEEKEKNDIHHCPPSLSNPLLFPVSQKLPKPPFLIPIIKYFIRPSLSSQSYPFYVPELTTPSCCHLQRDMGEWSGVVPCAAPAGAVPE